MRLSLLFLLFLSTLLSAGELTVVGLSGTQSRIRMNSHGRADFTKILSNLNIRHSLHGDSMVVLFDDQSVTTLKNDSVAIFGIDTISLDAKVAQDHNSVWANPNDISTIMNRLTNLTFRYDSEKQELRIQKVSAEFQNLTGVIVLDPGHGGKDPGAIGQDSTYEKDAVLAVSLKTAEYLRENSGLTVLLTREDDVFIPLRDRTTFANEKSADLFLSIHANASPKLDNVGGYKMFFLSDAKNESDERIAMMENAALDFEEDTSEIDLLQTILSDMINNEYLKESQDLSIQIEEAFASNVNDLEPLHTGVGQANFYVLRGATMPSVLVEVCFVSNSNEEKLLNSDHFIADVAEAIGSAILSFRYKYKDN